ncbi:MAG: MarR family winged helix-turn-helix transcriptional regulator [Acidimicrobiales bacterium]
MSQRYVLDEQVGFLLRKAHQRHTSIFTSAVKGQIPPSQFAVLAKLAEAGSTSQNELGRLTAMDSATIKGVVDRLIARGFLEEVALQDARYRVTDLTPAGREFVYSMVAVAQQITVETLEPLSADEQSVFICLLKKLG